MAPDLSIGIPYYRNQSMLAHQFATWASYPDGLKPRVEVILVDDASPEPAAAVERPAGLPAIRIFRLDGAPSTTPRWRQHAGRNRAAHEARAPWVLLTDMDHVLPATSLDALFDRLASCSSTDVLMFPRLDAPHLTPKLKNGAPHPHTNSFVVRRDRFWAIGGYDEELTGYGTDGFFLPKLKGKHLEFVRELAGCPIVRYSRDVIPDASTWADRASAKRRKHAHELAQFKERRGQGPLTLSITAELQYQSPEAA